MYKKFIQSIQAYLVDRNEITIARHVYSFRAKDSTFKEVLNKYLDLKDSDKIAILSEYN
jgi:hypothetical protein